MAIETLVSNKDEDGQDDVRIQQGIIAAEGWANGELVALLEPAHIVENGRIPAQRREPAIETYEPEEAGNSEDTPGSDTDRDTPHSKEGGKALFGTFGDEIATAGGVSIKGLWRGRDIIRYRNGRRQTVGRQTLRVFPGKLS